MNNNVKIMSVSPENKHSGKKEMKKYFLIAQQCNVDILLFPSSFLPFYKNSSSFYHSENIEKLPDSISGIALPNNSTKIIVGINEIDEKGRKYKTVVTFDKTKIIYKRRKRDIEKHYFEKGYFVGDDHIQFSADGIKINTLECFEILFSHNWEGDPHLITASVGFGMYAKTDHYDCDYFDQWLNIVKGNCIRYNCYAILSCNAQYRDMMTVAINSSGEVIGLARTAGFFIIDIDLNDFRKNKTPYLQE